jgi:hypothetical protein
MIDDQQPTPTKSPFVDINGWDQLHGLAKESVIKVVACYGKCGPLSSSEFKALSDTGMRLLPNRGQYLAWTTDESYFQTTVLRGSLRETLEWKEAVEEACATLADDQEIATLDWRHRYRSAQEASAEYQAAKQKAVRSGRLWGRWTEGHRTARLREGELKTIYETARHEADAQRRAGDSMDWLSEHLVGRTQFVANQTSMHCVGSSCVGVFEDEIGVRDARRMAAAVVIGQVTAGLMLEALISADSYRRLLNPWRTSVGREPWQADG